MLIVCQSQIYLTHYFIGSLYKIPYTTKIQGKRVNLFHCYEEPFWSEHKVPCIPNLD
jgi:hypothetical protein